MQRIVIIDYGMGNLHSAQKALQVASQQQAEVIISQDPQQILSADRVVLPGVGAMGDCMAALRASELDTILPDIIDQGVPLLGICVGMQMLMQHSEESGGTEGLGLLEGQLTRFPGGQDAQGQALKVPHMGWNQVEQVMHPLWNGIKDQSRFYFVHSYCAQAALPCSIGHSQHGIRFTAALAHKNIFATQFHPEKSHEAGLQLLANFVRWSGQA